MQLWRHFWAKTDRENSAENPEWFHPLWAHLFDVGNAALVLWERYLPERLKQIMAEGIGLPLHEAGHFLSIWIGLHDLGKAIPSFQRQHPYSKKVLEEYLPFHPDVELLHHGHASIAVMVKVLEATGFPSRGLLEAASACVGIHHGKLCHAKDWQRVKKLNKENGPLGGAGWQKEQLNLANNVLAAWQTSWPDPTQHPAGLTLICPDWLMYYAGWATLADWLGSMQSCYSQDVQPEDDLISYIPQSRTNAEKAFEKAGLHHSARLIERPLTEYFGPRFDPRPLQEVARDLTLTGTPTMVIIESSTGDGKTEAGFILAARHGGGVYVAMPSQSTANGLYPRLQEFLAGNPKKQTLGAHHGGEAGVRLVHGNDLLREDASVLLAVSQSLREIKDAEQPGTGNEGTARALTWFLPKKRALLAAYGVGTVDQAFLGVLSARHFFLRLFALAGKTVVFDEVHAYDAYMNTLFERLLGWLRALDTHVVILSATLPGETRRNLLKAWGAKESGPEDAPYPVAWQVAGGKLNVISFDAAEGRGQRLRFDWCDAGIEAIVQKAARMVETGACVLVICNTVDRAREVFEKLEERLAPVLPDPNDRVLLHARMPQSWRKKREQHALERFGKGRSAGPGLLVGTQVVEQSLDLDADALLTDLAPVDLLLQRAGRLHRHLENNRPPGFTTPQLVIACSPAETGQLPAVDGLSGNGTIYGKAILWKTWALLKQAGGWALPSGEESLPGYRSLVEGVYGDLVNPPPDLSADCERNYRTAYKEWLDKNGSRETEAFRRLIPGCGNLGELFHASKAELTEEDETEGKVPVYLQAFTRSPEGVNIEVILLEEAAGWWRLPYPDDPGILLPPGQPRELTVDEIRALFGASLRISKDKVVKALKNQVNEHWSAWQERNRALKRFQILLLHNKRCIAGGVPILLDERLGLVYEQA